MKNPQAEMAAKAQAKASELQSQLADQNIPMFQSIFGALGNELSGGVDNIVPFVKGAFDKSRTDLTSNIGQALRTGDELAKYRALTSDNPYTSGEVSSTISGLHTNLNREYNLGMKNLNFQEAQTGLQGYNALMNSLSGGINASLGLGNTALGNMNGAIAGMPTSTTGGNILAGAISGAASGSIVPGIGTIIGGVLGGVLGGLGGRG